MQVWLILPKANFHQEKFLSNWARIEISSPLLLSVHYVIGWPNTVYKGLHSKPLDWSIPILLLYRIEDENFYCFSKAQTVPITVNGIQNSFTTGERAKKCSKIYSQSSKPYQCSWHWFTLFPAKTETVDCPSKRYDLCETSFETLKHFTSSKLFSWQVQKVN